jgi:hypothetical protein
VVQPSSCEPRAGYVSFLVLPGGCLLMRSLQATMEQHSRILHSSSQPRLTRSLMLRLLRPTRLR